MLIKDPGRIERKRDRVLFDSDSVKFTLAKGVREQNNRREEGITLQLALRGKVSGLEEIHTQLTNLLQATEQLRKQQGSIELNNVYEQLVKLYSEAFAGDDIQAVSEPEAVYFADPGRNYPRPNRLNSPLLEYPLINHELLAEARDRLTDEGWLTTQEIALLGGYSKKNVSAQPTRWKAAGKIFSVIKRGVGNVYPQYGLDENYRPLPVMKIILDIFAQHKTSWGLAEWFATSNSLLAGKTPAEVVSTYPANVIQAAEYEVGRLKDGAE